MSLQRIWELIIKEKHKRFDWNELDEDLRAEEMELPTLAEEEKQERNHFFGK